MSRSTPAALTVLLFAFLLSCLASCGPAARASDPPGEAPKTDASRLAADLVGCDAEARTAALRVVEGADAALLRAVIRALGPAPEPAFPAAEGSGPLVQVSAWFLRAAKVEGVPSRGARALEEAEARALLDEAASGAGELVTAPRMTVYSGQKASLSVLDQISYVRDFEVEVAQSPVSPMFDPIVDTVSEGIVLDLVCEVVEGGARLAVQADATTSELVRPIETTKVVAYPGLDPVEIQLPELRVRGVRKALSLPPGGYALLELGAGEGARYRLLLRFETLDASGIDVTEIDLVPGEPPAPAAGR